MSKKGFLLGDLTVNEKEAAVVKTIFDRYVFLSRKKCSKYK
jgi:hypothetical protein